VPPPAAIIVSDVHLGHGSREPADRFHEFLTTVPARASHLVINGDLFEFWFEYKSVIPRRAYPTLEALGALRRAGVRLTVTGGNHDRWGGAFWTEELGATFHARGVELDLLGFRAHVQHGDGIAEDRWSAKVLHAVVRHSLTARLFRWMHPDVGLPLVTRLSPVLGQKDRDASSIERAAQRQRTEAEAMLAERPDLDLVVFGHTHRPQLVEFAPNRWFLNPGAWLDGQQYARLTASGPVLERFATGD
jgi:UDP-2,3-diacylglucosamine hydrolase